MYSHPNPFRSLSFEIAGISISLQFFQQLKETPAFIPFIRHTETPDYQVIFQQTDTLPTLPETVLYEGSCYRVHSAENGVYIRSFFDTCGDGFPYAAAICDYPGGRVHIQCLPQGNHRMSYMSNSFFHIGFEAMLIHKERLCLHAACVQTPSGGILFSGPSGIGKSTQAQLWCDHFGAKLINGDRPILSRGQTGWLAWGSPYAGSSRCHVNENCPVTAIVMLQQAGECRVQKLSAAEAFRSVWQGLTMYDWDPLFVEKAYDLTLDLIGRVPVYRFACTPDPYAAVFLERELRKEFSL